MVKIGGGANSGLIKVCGGLVWDNLAQRLTQRRRFKALITYDTIVSKLRDYKLSILGFSGRQSSSDLLLMRNQDTRSIDRYSKFRVLYHSSSPLCIKTVAS